MPTYLTDIKGEIGEKLRPALKAELGDTGLTQAVRDAVRAYSEVRPRRRRLNDAAGLSILAGVDSYDLPTDWMAWESVTWAAATEAPGERIQIYDGRGYGPLRMLMPPMRPTAGGALVPPKGSGYTVYPGNPPTLVVKPVPVAAGTLQTDYYALHVLTDPECTIPLGDWGLIVLRGLHEAYEALVEERSMRPTEFDVSGGGNRQRLRMADPADLQKQSATYLQRYNDRINRPAGVTT